MDQPLRSIDGRDLHIWNADLSVVTAKSFSVHASPKVTFVSAWQPLQSLSMDVILSTFSQREKSNSFTA